MDPSPPSLSVIVCSAARPDLVAGCVAALLTHSGWQPGDEVLVVLNGSGCDQARDLIAHETRRYRSADFGDGRDQGVSGGAARGGTTLGEATTTTGTTPRRPPSGGGHRHRVERTTFDGWTLGVHLSEERGIGAARNRGIALARGDVLVYLDDDARPRPGWLDAWRAAFAADPDLAATGGPIHPVWPGATPPWFHPRLGPYWGMLELRNETAPVPPGDRAYGANMAFRSRMVVAAGGFRTDIGWGAATVLAGEESDLLVRLHAAGHRLGWVPDAAVDHLVDPARRRLGYLMRRAYVHGRTDGALGASRPAPWAPLTTGWRSLIRSLDHEPRSWRSTATVDLARRARLAGRLRRW